MVNYLESLEAAFNDGLFNGKPEISRLLTDNVKDCLRNDSLEAIRTKDTPTQVISVLEEWKNRISTDFDLSLCLFGFEKLLSMHNRDVGLEYSNSLVGKHALLGQVMQQFDSNQDIQCKGCKIFTRVISNLNCGAETLFETIKGLVSTTLEATIASIRNHVTDVGTMEAATSYLFVLMVGIYSENKESIKFKHFEHFRDEFMTLGGLAPLFELLQVFPTNYDIVTSSMLVLEQLLRRVSVEVMHLPLEDLSRWREIVVFTEELCVQANADIASDIRFAADWLKSALDVCLEIA